MKKAFACVLFAVCSVCVFAQAQPRQILSDRDIDSFVKNYETIMETLDEHEDEFSALAEGLDTAEGDERTRGLMKLLGAPVSKELQAALSRQGMGNNGFAKTMTILFGLIMVALEDGLLDADNSDEEERAEAEEQIALFRKAMNGADVKLISQRKNELMPLLGHGF